MQTLGTQRPLPRPLSTSFVVSSPALSTSTSSTSSSVASSAASTASRDPRALLIRQFGIDKIVVPKSRRTKFDLELQIIDLNNVPLVSGSSYIKWHLEGSTRSLSRGQTTKEPIKDHKVLWNYASKLSGIRMSIGKDGFLQPQNLIFEIHQEYLGGRERIQLGTVTLNLAEYALDSRQTVTRRYLMQGSKINSTVKIGITMFQVGGDREFYTPPLKGAQVFSGIAGILGDQRSTEADTQNLSSLTSQSRESSATQDIYRRTLAASWQLQAGELTADECIEDIFCGGDGWTSSFPTRRKPKSVMFERKDSDSDSLSARSQRSAEIRNPSPILLKVPTVTARGMGRRRTGKELDEMEAREDLVSWRLPS